MATHALCKSPSDTTKKTECNQKVTTGEIEEIAHGDIDKSVTPSNRNLSNATKGKKQDLG